MILMAFTPFGMHTISTFLERFIVALGYGLVAFVSWFVLLVGIRKIQPVKYATGIPGLGELSSPKSNAGQNKTAWLLKTQVLKKPNHEKEN